MSTVDNRVVQMEFDNQKFESGVGVTLNTLTKLKEALNFKKGNFEELQRGADSVNFNPLSDKIVQVQQQFSLLGEFARNVFDRISNKVIDTAVTLGKSLTIEPITAGFQEYETQMDAVQTIMANTQAAFADATTEEHLGAVNNALDELNTYADKTIYNFTEMTRNIGTFTAAGVGLDTAKSSIQGIANLAAVSGSNSQQASTAMYQLSQAIAAGSVKLQDWNSVVNAGMGGQVFQDALKKTAREHGVAVDEMIEKHGSFRESLQEGWISADILTETLGKMTDVGLAEYFAEATGQDKDWIQSQIEAIEQTEDREAAIQKLSEKLSENGKITQEDAKQYLDLMITAQDAATKVKTFSQLIDTVKEGLGSGWTQSMEYILGDFEEAKELWSGVYKEIDSVITPIANARNEMLKFWHDNGGRTTAIKAIGDAWQGVKAIVGAVADAFKSVFKPLDGKQLVEITNHVADMAAKFKEFATSSTTLAAVKDIFEGLFGAIKMGVGIVQALFTALSPVFSVLGSFGAGIAHAASRLGYFITLMSNASDPLKFFIDSLQGIGLGGAVLTNVLRSVVSAVESLIKGLLNIVGINITSNPLTEFFDRLRGFASEHLHFPSLETLTGLAQGVMDALSKLGGFISDRLNGLFSGLGSALDSILGPIGSAKKGLSEVSESVDDASKSFDALEIAKGIFQRFIDFVGSFGSKIAEFAGNIGANIPKMFEFLGSGELRNIITNFNLLMTGGLINSVRKYVDVLREAKENLANATSSKGGISGLFDSIKEKAEDAVEKFSGVLDKLQGSLQAFTNNLNASALMKIAIAIGILAASIAILAHLDTDKMANGMVGVAASMGILVAAFKALDSGSGEGTSDGVNKMSTTLIKMAIAVGILAISVKTLSSLSLSELASGLIGIGGAMALMVAAVAGLSRYGGSIEKSAKGMITFSIAIGILSSSVLAMSSLSLEGLLTGLLGVAALLASVAGFSRLVDSGSLTMKASISVLLLSAAIKVLESSVLTFAALSIEQLLKGLGGVVVLLMSLGAYTRLLDSGALTVRATVGILATVAAIKALEGTVILFASMNWEQFARGLGGVAALLVGLGAFSAAMKGNSMDLQSAASLAIITAAIVVLSSTMQSIAGMGWEELARGLVGLAGSISIMTIALELLGAGSGSALLGAAAITVLSIALRIFIPVLQALAGISVEDLVKSLVGLAAAFVVLGVAGAAFGAFSSLILLGSLALAALGAACLVVGAGLLVAAAGITAFAASLVAASTSIIASASIITVGIITMITSIAVGIANGIVQFAVTLLNGVGQVLAALGSAIHAIGDFVLGNLPYLCMVLSQIIIGLLQVAATAIPQFIAVVSQLVIALIQAVVTWLPPLAQTLVTGVITLVNSVANGIRDNAEQILAAVRNIISAVIELLITALADIVRLIPGIGPDLANQINGAKDIVRQTLAPESFEQMGKEAVDGVTTGVQNGTGDLQNAADTAGKGALEGFSLPLSDTGLFEGLGGGIVDGAATGIQNGSLGLQDIAGMAGQGAFDGFANPLSDPTSLGEGFTNGLTSSFVGAEGAFGEAGAVDINAYLNNFGDTEAAQSGANNVVNTSLGELNGHSEEFAGSGGQNLSTYLNNFKNTEAAKNAGTSITSNSVSGLDSNASAFSNAGKGNFNSFNKSLSNIDASRQTGELNASSAAAGSSSKTDQFTNAGRQSFNSWKNGVSQNSAANTVGVMLTSSGAKGASSKNGAWGSAGKSAADAFVNRVGSSNAGGQGGALSSSGANGASSRRGEYEGAGSYVADGFNFSIANGYALSLAHQKGAELGKAALDGVKDAINSASPSKEAMKLGGYTSEGYIIGIQKLIKYAERAGGRLGKKTLDALAESSESIVAFANTDFDIDPTIRPVLDLSEVQNGVSRANALIGGINSKVSIGSDSYAKSVFGGMGRSARNPMQSLARTFADQNAQQLADVMQQYATKDLDKRPGDIVLNVYGVTGPNEVADAVGQRLKLIGLV